MSRDLPPGVSLNMIPGNRPEDEEDERFWLKLEERFKKECPDHEPIIDSIFSHELDTSSLPNPANQIEAAVVALVTVARDMAYSAGFNEGKLEAEISREPTDEPV